MTRIKSMSAINAALDQPIQPAPGEPIAPHVLPGQATETPLVDNLPGEKTEPLEDDSELSPDQTRKQQLLQSAGQINAAQRAYNAAANVTSGAGAKLETLPTPGSIVLPLTILLTFFFLLLPVNGHTRATWLWLALTGNADVNNGGSGGSKSNQNPVVDSTLSTSSLSQPVDVQSFVSALSAQMTGVEDLG